MSGFYSSPVALSSLDDTWTTPLDFFRKQNEQFNFTLDAAALSSSALCENWYGPDHLFEEMRDCLVADWVKDSGGGSVWMNPPYGRNIKPFMAKADSESKRGITVVCLVPARTDTAWFQDYCLPHKVEFIRGRLKFGGSKDAAPFPSALVVMGKS